MAQPDDIRVIEFLISSDSSDDDEDIILLRNIADRRRKVPRIRNYIRDVVDDYNDNEVCI